MSSLLSDDETTIGHASDQYTNYSNLGQHMENFNVEASALHRKLQSKTDALRILRKELERFRTERDQFKLMAETLQLRFSSIKKSSDYCCGIGGAGNKPSSVAKLLHETRERNIKLTTEVESLKSKLTEMQGDIELLRESNTSKEHQQSRKTLGCKSKISQTNKEGCLEWQHERANFICHLEHLKKKNAQLAFDFKSLIDEKEELTMERDAYKCKAHRLNHELLAALKANERHPKFLDIDSVLLENKYLHERLQSCENDLDLAKQSVCKYKTILETKRKKGIMKLGTSSNDESILSHKQVKSLLESGIELPTKTETIHDLKSLCLTLLDNLNDKNIALNHQKRTNKILGTKIAELEQRIQMLSGIEASSETSGYSATQFLLQGYCPSLVDSNDTTTETTTQTTTTSTTITTNEISNNKPRDKTATTHDDEFKPSSSCYSDDGASSSVSTESARSVLSSEYGGGEVLKGVGGISIGATDVGNYIPTFNEFTNNALLTYRTPATTTTSTTGDSGVLRFGGASNTTTTIALVSSAIEKERENDLKDLPPDLAALVQQALRELDMREFETKVILRDAQLNSKKCKRQSCALSEAVAENIDVGNEVKEAAADIDEPVEDVNNDIDGAAAK